MDRVDQEQRFALCYKCTTGLSYLENYFFGNRCLFCADTVQNINLISFLRKALISWKIYQELIKLREKKGTEGILLFRGILGSLGFQDINEIKSLSIEKEILKELRRL